jgi:hypothetical protein
MKAKLIAVALTVFIVALCAVVIITQGMNNFGLYILFAMLALCIGALIYQVYKGILLLITGKGDDDFKHSRP